MRTLFLIALAGVAFSSMGQMTSGVLHVNAPPRLRIYVDGKFSGVTPYAGETMGGNGIGDSTLGVKACRAR